ncbi:MRN complex-interacting protein N-terminal domain-containing protein [Entamoeba marina]
MPQEFVLLQCYSCFMFQVHIRNKAKKFACKVCGAKQSYRKILAISDKAKDLRKVCGEYNKQRIEEVEEFDPNAIENTVEIKQISPTSSKWEKYKEDDEVVEGDLSHFFIKTTTYDKQQKKRSKVKKSVKKFNNDVVNEIDDINDINHLPLHANSLSNNYSIKQQKSQQSKPITKSIQTTTLRQPLTTNEHVNEIDDLLALFETTEEPLKPKEKKVKSPIKKLMITPQPKSNSPTKQNSSIFSKLKISLQAQTTNEDDDKFLFQNNSQPHDSNDEIPSNSKWGQF